MQQFTQVKLYFQAIQDLHIDTEFMPLERLSKPQLLKAKSYLTEIQELIHEMLETRKRKDFADIDLDELLRIQEEIAERSSRFYELIPHKEYRTDPVPPIDNDTLLNQKFSVIETLLSFEVTSKILLGAHLCKLALNPLNYCFNAINIRMMMLPNDHPEFGLIQTYIERSATHEPGFIKNVFAIERRGEAERFEAWKKFGNRKLLWHGSKVSNFMGILAQGLKGTTSTFIQQLHHPGHRTLVPCSAEESTSQTCLKRAGTTQMTGLYNSTHTMACTFKHRCEPNSSRMI
jgi:hypothetical protein